MTTRWMEKLAAGSPDGGHWRRLPAGHRGHDQFGNETVGKTWVRGASKAMPIKLRTPASVAGPGLPPSHKPALATPKPPSPSKGLKEGFKPYKHQQDFDAAVKGLPKQRQGIIAAHGTGTGKTFGSIATFERMRQEGRAKRALVITPAGLRENYLVKGVNKFTHSKGISVKNTKTQAPEDAGYVVVSYEAFRMNPQAYLDAYKPDTIIADEVHRASNPDSKTFKALMYARQRVPRFMGLTASIVQNDPADVVPLLQLARGDTSMTKEKFRRRYVRTVKTRERGIFGGAVKKKVIVNQAMLRRDLGPNIHYVEDLDAGEKPPKHVETVPVEMSGPQKKLYELSMEGIDPVIRAKIAAGEPVKQQEALKIFTRILRARQVSNSLHNMVPGLTLGQAAEQTPKIKKILDDASQHISTTPDAQVIIYTNLVKGGVDIISAGLTARGVKHGVFAGRGVPGMTEEARQQAVRDYQDGKSKVIIITGAGAEGLSLGNTTMVQLADGHYNPERISQAEARGVRAGGQAHRPVEKRGVTVKRYVSALPKGFWRTITFREAPKSVDQWVYATAQRKAEANRGLRDAIQARSQHETKKRESVLYRLFGGGP